MEARQLAKTEGCGAARRLAVECDAERLQASKGFLRRIRELDARERRIIRARIRHCPAVGRAGEAERARKRTSALQRAVDRTEARRHVVLERRARADVDLAAETRRAHLLRVRRAVREAEVLAFERQRLRAVRGLGLERAHRAVVIRNLAAVVADAVNHRDAELVPARRQLDTPGLRRVGLVDDVDTVDVEREVVVVPSSKRPAAGVLLRDEEVTFIVDGLALRHRGDAVAIEAVEEREVVRHAVKQCKRLVFIHECVAVAHGRRLHAHRCLCRRALRETHRERRRVELRVSGSGSRAFRGVPALSAST